MTLYATDYHAWIEETIQALRERRWDDLDIEALCDGVASLGNAEVCAIGSRLKIILIHILKIKLKYQPGRQTRNWCLLVIEQRNAVSDLLNKSPSLRAKLDELVIGAYSEARLQVSQEIATALDVFPEKCEWTGQQVLEDVPDTTCPNCETKTYVHDIAHRYCDPCHSYRAESGNP